ALVAVRPGLRVFGGQQPEIRVGVAVVREPDTGLEVALLPRQSVRVMRDVVRVADAERGESCRRMVGVEVVGHLQLEDRVFDGYAVPVEHEPRVRRPPGRVQRLEVVLEGERHAFMWRGRLFDHPTSLEQSGDLDRKSTRLNSSHVKISYAVFCLKKQK